MDVQKKKKRENIIFQNVQPLLVLTYWTILVVSPRHLKKICKIIAEPKRLLPKLGTNMASLAWRAVTYYVLVLM